MGLRETTFGDLLRRYRTEAGLTQEELAERAGLSTRGISDLERGVNRAPYRATVQRLIEALELDAGAAEELGERAKGRRAPRAAAAEQMSLQARLPHPVTPILGRERETGTILHLLRWEGKRLVTLTGTGGVGKTRLALQAAEEAKEDYADGAFFVGLAAITDAAFVPTAIASALGIQVAGRTSVEEAVEGGLRDREVLLVLDNFEQVLEAGTFVSALLSGCPKLKVVITSREPLHLRGEQQAEVGPLAVPEDGRSWTLEELRRVPSVALFVERARSVKSSFALTTENRAAVIEICRRLEGLPLAIELAAAHVKYAAPRRLLLGLDRRLEALQGGARDLPARQQTMRDTIAWSYGLLGDSEQKAFRWLAVFAGGCMIEAAEAVLAGSGLPVEKVREGLHALVEKSLLVVQADEDGPSRFLMLETIREYGLERLGGAGESEQAHRRHVQYFIHLVTPMQQDWARLANLDRETRNLREALAWSRDAGDTESVLHLASALRLFWSKRGYFREGLQWLEPALARSDGCDAHVRADALSAAGEMYLFLDFDSGNLSRTERLEKQALALYKDSGDLNSMARSLNRLGRSAMLGDVAKQQRYLEAALAVADQVGDRRLGSGILLNLSGGSRRRGDHDEADAMVEEALQLAWENRDSYVEAIALRTLAAGGLFRREYARAESLVRECIRLFRAAHDNVNLLPALGFLGETLAAQGKYEEASTPLEVRLALARELAMEAQIADTLWLIGAVSFLRGERQEAEHYYRESLLVRRTLSSSEAIAESLEGMAGLACASGNCERAVRLCAAAERLRQSVGAPRGGLVQDLYDGYISTTRAQLEASKWQQVWEEGWSMATEQAIAYALVEPT